MLRGSNDLKRAINSMANSVDGINPEHVLTLIEQVHSADKPSALRQIAVHGIGALIESVSCAWTELEADLFQGKIASTPVVDVSDKSIDVDKVLVVFNRYAWQHPVINHVIKTPGVCAMAISDLLTRSEFNQLELYQLFYKPQIVEDQFSVGYCENGLVKGISVNRASWGFTDSERHAMVQIAACVFPYYRLLQQSSISDAQPRSVLNSNTIDIVSNREALGVTHREAELLSHVACGKSNKQIAALCGISEGTVRKHIENAFRRLGVNNRISAIMKSAQLIDQSVNPG